MSALIANDALPAGLVAVVWVIVNFTVIALTWNDQARIRAVFERLPDNVKRQLGLENPVLWVRRNSQRLAIYGYPSYCRPTAEERAALKSTRAGSNLLALLFLVTLFILFRNLLVVGVFLLPFIAIRLMTPDWPQVEMPG